MGLIQSDKFDTFKGYPWTPAFNSDNPPQAFQSASLKAKQFLNTYDHLPKVVVLNEWNEESYLLPDTKTGEKYLEAVKNVLGKK